MKILIIDDMEEFAVLFKAKLAKAEPRGEKSITAWMQEIEATLARNNYELVFASNGDDALSMYRQQGPFQLVLTDIHHPGPDGLELSMTIRKENPIQAIAVITGGASDEQLNGFNSLGIPVAGRFVAMESLPDFVAWASDSSRKRHST